MARNTRCRRYGQRPCRSIHACTKVQSIARPGTHAGRSNAAKASPASAQAATAFWLISAAKGWVASMTWLIIFGLQIAHQPSHTAKPANPLGQGLRHRVRRATGIGKHRIHPGIGQGCGP